MKDINSIAGRSFLITGGAAGLGAGYAKAFLEEGAKKVAILDKDEDLGKAKSAELNKQYPGRVVFFKCDVSNEDSIVQAFKEVVTQLGTFDIINNAGIMNDTPDIWRTACEVNWEAVVSFTLKGIKHLRKDEGGNGGTIINVSSVVGLTPLPMLPIYSGSKAAVLWFSRAISMGPFNNTTGIRIITLCIGPTDTPLLHNLHLKTYDENNDNDWVNTPTELKIQTTESVVKYAVKIYNKGAPGSVWCINNNNPAVDLTSVIDSAYRTIAKAADLPIN